MAEEGQRQRQLRGVRQGVFVLLTLAGLALAINQLFNLRFFAGIVLLENRYLYLLLATFFAPAFLLFPAGGRPGGRARAFILFVSSLYPVYAGALPGPIAGFSLSFPDTIRYQSASVEAILGIPMRVFGTLLVGFILFGVALHVTGAGRFFTGFAMALLGTVRGGTAKVAIVASGLFGTMSGSAVSNVLATGVLTIPAMKRTGFRAGDAAGGGGDAPSGGGAPPPRR